MSELSINNFRDRVYLLMSDLPADKVTTYGDLAALAGHPYAARRVGEIAHGGPDDLPWHRLVNFKGGLAVGFPGGQQAQRQLLAADGIDCDDNYKVVNFAERRWRPKL
ncbi:cysteine methyltransferase [Candidatus Saccharibacteria bacterium]|nr:MAG: cysteine methyltransferase [Candidatus Saccharibacteria bacterium]